LALDGYCPTTLVERQQWALGDVRFGAIHRGRTYLFLGPGEVQKFMADPEKYAPVLSGNDPVAAMDNQQLVPGRREYGVYSDNRVYLFADETTRQRFEQNPKRYAAEALQAATPPATAVR
jgi:protein disulfide-isomerase